MYKIDSIKIKKTMQITVKRSSQSFLSKEKYTYFHLFKPKYFIIDNNIKIIIDVRICLPSNKVVTDSIYTIPQLLYYEYTSIN